MRKDDDFVTRLARQMHERPAIERARLSGGRLDERLSGTAAALAAKGFTVHTSSRGGGADGPLAPYVEVRPVRWQQMLSSVRNAKLDSPEYTNLWRELHRSVMNEGDRLAQLVDDFNRAQGRRVGLDRLVVLTSDAVGPGRDRIPIGVKLTTSSALLESTKRDALSTKRPIIAALLDGLEPMTSKVARLARRPASASGIRRLKAFADFCFSHRMTPTPQPSRERWYPAVRSSAARSSGNLDDLRQKAEWEAALRETATLADGLGMGMDRHVVKVVTALRLMGFTTIQSCGGHLSPHRGWMYVILGSRHHYAIDDQARKLEPGSQTLASLAKQAAELVKPEEQRLRSLVDEFNGSRIRSRVPGHPRLVVIGAAPDEGELSTDDSTNRRWIYTLAVQGLKETRALAIPEPLTLQVARHEMNAFADFLLGKHFGPSFRTGTTVIAGPETSRGPSAFNTLT